MLAELPYVVIAVAVSVTIALSRADPAVDGHAAADHAALFRYAFAIGRLGVEFPVALNGFVLTWAARPDDSVRCFWRYLMKNLSRAPLLGSGRSGPGNGWKVST
jgi:hypothetical protein